MERMTRETLWKLRQEIVLGSIYYHDYDNSFGFTANSVCDFFDGYLEELWDMAIEQWSAISHHNYSVDHRQLTWDRV